MPKKDKQIFSVRFSALVPRRGDQRGLWRRGGNLVQKSFWQNIFSQSRVNGAPYFGEDLPEFKWQWPQQTFLREHLKRHKES